MFGLSSQSKEAIAKRIEDVFDHVSLSIIGNIPRLAHKKLFIFSSEPTVSLSNIFIQGLNNQTPNPTEQDVLKGLLQSAHSYIEALKEKTKANITEGIDALVKQAKVKKLQVKQDDIEELISKEMYKAESHLKMIIETESTKMRNIGKVMDILKMAGSVGDSDPNLFFVINRATACVNCYKMHMMPNKIAPKIWKFSDLKQGFWKKGDEVPSISGIHPNCKCSISYLPPGFGFNSKGLIDFKNKTHNEYENQRKK